MAYRTTTKPVTSDWTLVTASNAIVQFNDKMYMALTDGTVPTSVGGLRMEVDEKFENTLGTSVYVKDRHGGTNRSSVVVAEDI